MNHQIMPTDLHSPSFNRVDKTASQQDNAPSSVPAPKQVHRFSWTRFIGLVTLLALLIGFVSLLSKLVTPQVVTAISILGSFLLLRFVVKVILQILLSAKLQNATISLSAMPINRRCGLLFGKVSPPFRLSFIGCPLKRENGRHEMWPNVFFKPLRALEYGEFY